jgi:hypothetical protein
VVASILTFVIFPDLPIVRPVNVELNVHPVFENADEKLELEGSILSWPIPLKTLLEGFGELFCKTSVPALMVLLPL